MNDRANYAICITIGEYLMNEKIGEIENALGNIDIVMTKQKGMLKLIVIRFKKNRRIKAVQKKLNKENISVSFIKSREFITTCTNFNKIFK